MVWDGNEGGMGSVLSELQREVCAQGMFLP